MFGFSDDFIRFIVALPVILILLYICLYNVKKYFSFQIKFIDISKYLWYTVNIQVII